MDRGRTRLTPGVSESPNFSSPLETQNEAQLHRAYGQMPPRLSRTGMPYVLPPPQQPLPHFTSAMYDQTHMMGSVGSVSHHPPYPSRSIPQPLNFGNRPLHYLNYPTPLPSPSVPVPSSQATETPSMDSPFHIAPINSFSGSDLLNGRDERRNSQFFSPHTTSFAGNGNFDGFQRQQSRDPLWTSRTPFETQSVRPYTNVGYMNIPPPQQGMLPSQGTSSSSSTNRNDSVLTIRKERTSSQGQEQQHSQPVSPTGHPSPPRDKMDISSVLEN